jgi:hypothetical protein
MAKRKTKDWTKPSHLNEADWYDLAEIRRLCNKKQYREAMEYAMYRCDTIIREEIPPDIWLKMGGRLTETGLENLRKLQAKRKKKARK